MAHTEWCTLPSCSEEFTPDESSDHEFCSWDCRDQFDRELHDNGDCQGPGFCDECDGEELGSDDRAAMSRLARRALGL